MNISKTFESEKNRKALTYTIIICGALLLMFILISWKVMPPPEPVVQDLIEVNLGNEFEGLGEEQPLIKGERSPVREETSVPKPAPEQHEVEKVTPDDNAEDDAAPVTKPEKTVPKVTAPPSPKPVVVPAPKPAKPKVTYDGPGKGGGNNATEDNGYKNQGNNPNGNGDAGSPNGNKDSYGNTPGGKVGGPKVIQGNRKIVRFYSFTGTMPKATIYAMIRVSASGQGTFIKIVKPSTSFDARYGAEISNNIRNVVFDKGSGDDDVVVQFNFMVQ